MLSVIDVDLAAVVLRQPGRARRLVYGGNGRLVREPPHKKRHNILNRGEPVIILCKDMNSDGIEYYEILSRHGHGWVWVFDVAP